eukprot:1348585-Amphidinium_carterae.2
MTKTTSEKHFQKCIASPMMQWRHQGLSLPVWRVEKDCAVTLVRATLPWLRVLPLVENSWKHTDCWHGLGSFVLSQEFGGDLCALHSHSGHAAVDSTLQRLENATQSSLERLEE